MARDRNPDEIRTWTHADIVRAVEISTELSGVPYHVEDPVALADLAALAQPKVKLEEAS